MFLAIPLLAVIAVGYNSTMYTTSESEGVVELTVAILYPPSGRAPRPFTVLTSTEDATAGMIIHFRNSKCLTECRYC